MKIKVGEYVVFRKPKSSTHPSPRAKQLRPTKHGDSYSYIIDKFWKVVQVFDDDTIEVETRRGKRNRVDVNSPQLRKVGFFERFFFRKRLF